MTTSAGTNQEPHIHLGDEKSGTTAASRRPICGEELYETAAERSSAFDLTGEGRRSGSERGGRRRLPVSREKKEGKGELWTFLQKSPWVFL